RLRERLQKIQRPAIAFLPVVKSNVANLNRGRAIEFILRTDRAALQRRDTYRDLEGGARRIGRTKRARKERNIRIVLQLLEFFRRDIRDERIGIERGP